MRVRCAACNREHEVGEAERLMGFPCRCGAFIEAEADGHRTVPGGDGFGGLVPVAEAPDAAFGGLVPVIDEGALPVAEVVVAPRSVPPPPELEPLAPRPWRNPSLPAPRRRELGLLDVLAYPLASPVVFFSFAAFLGLVGFGRGFSWYVTIFYELGLSWWTLLAISGVADGDDRTVRPTFRERSDVWKPGLLGLLAVLVPSLPLLVALVATPPRIAEGGIWGVLTAPIEEPSTEAISETPIATAATSASAAPSGVPPELMDESVPEEARRAVAKARLLAEGPRAFLPPPPPEPKGVAPWVKVAAVVGLVGRLLLAPAFLVVAAITRNVWSVLIPLNALQYVGRLGKEYAKAVAIVVAVLFVSLAMEHLLREQFVLARVVGPFWDAYAALVTGAALGLAVRRRRHELGLGELA